MLRAKWPIAFPVKSHEIRPLAAGSAAEIAATMGWSLSYARGVLLPWKMSAAYCRAVLSYDQRIGLDGTPAEPVDAVAKDSAAKQLANLEARNAAKQAAAAAKAKPTPAPPTKTPALRDWVRAGLLRRRA